MPPPKGSTASWSGMGAERTVAGSLSALIVAYSGSAALMALRPSTHRDDRNNAIALRA